MNEPVEVLITLPFMEAQLGRIRAVSPRLRVTVFRAHRPEEVPPEIWGRTQVLYTNRVLPLPAEAPNLRWIQFHWAGADHAIEAPILRKPGLVATTLSGAAASQMAEYILMMLLALGHCLPDLAASQQRKEWPKDRWERFSPCELRDSTVGIVGYGSVGRQVARLLRPFGARVLATKRDVMHPADPGYTPEGWGDPNGDFVHRLYPPEALQSMVKVCDFVVVTAPLTPATRGMIGAPELAAFKQGAFIVDTSRGGVIDHGALINAFKDHRLGGAALDVFPEEPLPEDSPLWKMPNVFISPHISGNTPAYDDRAVDLFAENLRRYLSGQSVYNIIDLEQGY